MKKTTPSPKTSFVRGKSTVEALKALTTTTDIGLANSLSTGVMSIDIEKAFDRVWHDGLIFKLIRIGYPAYLTRISDSFLRNRHFQVKLEDTISDSIDIPYGLPQGIALSPTFYNIYTSDIPINIKCKSTLFSDDTVIYTSDRLINNIKNRLRHCK